jgi:hypothetical protein
VLAEFYTEPFSYEEHECPYDSYNCGLGYAILPIMVLAKLGFVMWSVVFHRLETRMKFKGQGYPKNYVVLASKARLT